MTLTLGLLTGVIEQSEETHLIAWAVWVIPAGMVLVMLLIRTAPRLPGMGRRLEALADLRFNILHQAAFVLAYSLAWAAASMGSACFFGWFIPLDSQGLWRMASWVIISQVAGFLSAFSPAGLGVREGILVLGLISLVPPPQAAALALALRLWTSAVETVSFALCGLLPGPPPQTASAERINEVSSPD